ncbi:hypothetical protein [Ktedonobacter racemifer]|nr:hypothetical protein [Ktedonobacter racemifer]
MSKISLINEKFQPLFYALTGNDFILISSSFTKVVSDRRNFKETMRRSRTTRHGAEDETTKSSCYPGVPDEASCTVGAPFRMKKNSMDEVGTLRRKDPDTKNDGNNKAVKLEDEAVFGCLEEPLIVAPIREARRGKSHVERRPVGDLSEQASNQFSGGTSLEVVSPQWR